MAEKYSREQLWEFYKKLPEELKEAAFSIEAADVIQGVCQRNKIEEDKISKITEYVGNVLLGLLPPEDFQNTLEEELKLEKETIEKVAQEINRFIFYPVKPALEQLYKTGAVSKEETERPVIEKTERKPAKEDIYKEPIE